MDLKDIAEELVAGCREGRETANLDRLYAADAVSVEALDHGQGRETRGLDGIRGKHTWWEENFDVLSQELTGPMLHGDDRFAVVFDVLSREKDSGKEMRVTEVALYYVSGGRIVREEFFTA